MRIELTRGWDGETIKAGEVANAHDALVWLRENSPSDFWDSPEFVPYDKYKIIDFDSYSYFGRLWV